MTTRGSDGRLSALHAVCSACRIGGRQVPATHASRYGDGHAWCNEHARPGDPPLTVRCEECYAVLCCCDMPDDSAIDESNARAAARRESRPSILGPDGGGM